MDDDAAMAIALDEARRAGQDGDVPVGAVVLIDGAVVSQAGNRRERDGDPTAHAELLALRAAAAATGSWRLDGATLVVTLEPCPMCAGALVGARVARVVFGAANTENGSCGTRYNLCADPRLNHEVAVVHGVQAEAATALLDDFFTARRP
jgi:tRNA(adenine34) deaminase